MLLLFDIDATMISTSGSGMGAMLDAGRELYGDSFSTAGIDFAGRLDPLIIADLFRKHAVDWTPHNIAEYRAVYQRHLVRRLEDQVTIARALPGVLPLLEELRKSTSLTLGVLTGNFAETGSLKLRRCGIEPAWFHLHVWGDESPSTPPTREDLPGVAMKKYLSNHGRPIAGEHVVVIGDTPHDVRCAKAHGCRSLAVATGSFTLDQLAACQPTRAVSTLADWRDVAQWLVRP